MIRDSERTTLPGIGDIPCADEGAMLDERATEPMLEVALRQAWEAVEEDQ